METIIVIKEIMELKSQRRINKRNNIEKHLFPNSTTEFLRKTF
jgi:hypothetical protein